MEQHNKILQKKGKIIAATIGLLILNALLSISLTNVTPDQTGTQTTSWNEIFIYARSFSILVYLIYLLSLFDKPAKIEKEIVRFAVTHIDIIFLFVIFAYLALYEMYSAYFADYSLSPDSSEYLRESLGLLAGNGFYVDKLAGYTTWFATFPIGYPVLIALSTFISGHSVYFGSKLLSIALVGIGLFVLRLRFKKDAWIFSLIYLNIGFLEIYKCTWSENPFILSLIIWGISLSGIVEAEIPQKQWYALTILGCLGAFLSRYFGIVTILFTGFCLLLYILYYLFFNQNIIILAKIKGLFCVEIISSIAVGLYFFMNQVMAGTISGSNRLFWEDDYNELIISLYSALTAEIFNATRINIGSLMPGFSPKGRAAVIILFLFILTVALVKEYQRKKKFDYKMIFTGAGLFYYLVFIVVRFYSSMDGISYRFFAPAGMMVSIGVLGLIKDNFGDNLKKFQIVTCLFLLILCGGLILNIKHYTIESSAYHIFYNQVMNSVTSIPSESVILNYTGDRQLRAFRPDIMTNGQIAYDDTIETLLSKYNNSKSIWIRRDALNTIVKDENYSSEIRNTFSQFVEDRSDETEYIQIF